MSPHPNAQRLRVIIISGPFFFGLSYLLYKRLYLGEQQRKFNKLGEAGAHEPILTRPAGIREVVNTLEGRPRDANSRR